MKAWRIRYDGEVVITGGRTRGAARWRLIETLREVGYIGLHEMPRGAVSVTRAPEYDGRGELEVRRLLHERYFAGNGS